MKQKMITNEILDELKEIRILPITYTESEQDALDAVIHLLENLDERISNNYTPTNTPPKQLHYSADDNCTDVVQWAK